MFCSQCGVTLNEDARFCNACGSRTMPPARALDAGEDLLIQSYEARPQVQGPTARAMEMSSTSVHAAPEPCAAVPPPGYYPPPQVHVSQQVQISQPAFVGMPKSVGVGLLLTFFFGPLGLFYSSTVGGIVMLLVSIFFGGATMGAGLLLTWPACMIWGAIAASNHNSAIMARAQSMSQINRY